MKIYPSYSLLLFCSLLLLQNANAQSEMNLWEQIKNRITINHENGEKEEFIVTPKTVNAKSQQLYHWYQAQRVQQTQGGYSGKLLHGNYSRYSRDKQIMLQGPYRKGVAHGLWKEWRPNARLAKEEHWRNGKLNGKASHYDEQGNLSLQGKMKDGEWHGKVWTLDSADNSYRWDYYAHGKHISQDEYVNANFLRRTGQFFEDTWNSIFRKEIDPTPITE